MKRFYLFLLFLTSFTFTQAQVLLTEGFEGSTFPPAGWTILKSGNGNNFTSNQNPNLTDGPYVAHSGTGTMVYEYNSTNAANAWAITPALNLSAGVSYSISFAYRVASSGYPEKLKVTVGNAPTIEDQSTILWSNNGGTQLTITRWQIGVIQYTPTSSGIVYFGFNCFSDADKYALLLDDIRVETTPASAPVCTANILPANNATNINIPVTFTWNASSNATSYDFYIGTSTTPTIFNNYAGTSVTLTRAYNTKYYWYVVPRNAAGIPTGCASSITSFTTGAPPLPPGCATMTFPANNATNVSDTLTFAWNAAPGATSYDFYFGETINTLDSLGATSSTSVQFFSPLDYNTTYYWKVVPKNAGGQASGCPVFSFKTQSPPLPPGCVNLLAPANNATNVSAPVVTFTWNKESTATGYRFIVRTGSSKPDTLDLSTDTTVSISPFAFSTTYTWQVIPFNGGGFGIRCTTTSSFTTKAAPPVPANDNCSGAVAISAYVPVSGYTFSATESMPAEACGTYSDGSPIVGDANDDVWYKFTALRSGAATITLTPNEASFDAVMMAYSGTCGTLTNIKCADAGIDGDNETLSLTGLVAGTTYYIRVYGYYGAGELREGSFTLTASGVALPVTLVDFKGEHSGSKNLLTWTTQTEQNSEGFELQRSIDGTNYSSIAFVASKAIDGNSTSKLQYSYEDALPLAGNNYYRLKQVDKDRNSAYSSVVFLKGANAAVLRLSAVYPNPVSSSLKVVVSAPANNKINVIVTDLAGKIVMQKSAQIVAGDNNLQLDVARLAAGSYAIKAICNNGCETAVSKFVKQ